jgi:hypothetical protein
MNLDEFKVYVQNKREESRLKGMSVLSATITTSNPKEGK